MAKKVRQNPAPTSQPIDGKKAQTAIYIKDLVTELEALAAREGLEPLQFMLARAREAAKQAAQSE